MVKTGGHVNRVGTILGFGKEGDEPKACSPSGDSAASTPINWLNIFLVTTLELVALAAWLSIISLEDNLIPPANNELVAAGVLLSGLFIERRVGFGISPAFINSRNISAAHLAILSVSETVIWISWLYLAGDGVLDGDIEPVTAALALALLMFFQHNTEFSLLSGNPPFGRLFNLDTIDSTILKAIGGVGWLHLVNSGQAVPALGLLFACLLLKNYRQDQALEPPETEPEKPRSRVDNVRDILFPDKE
jgi:hypothetical protein